MPGMDHAEVDAALAGSAWRREGDAVVRDLTLPDFAAAIAFVGRVAEGAEAANHHPDMLVHAYDRVRLTLTTHGAGAITRAELDLARQIDALAS
jgi:4a-hydroxytetrahydrobiopterin dehydratase